MLLVHLQKSRIRMKEMEIHVLCGLNESNGDALKGLIISYRNLLFPGSTDVETDSNAELERRKAALAKEAEKAFIVKPVDIKKVMQRANENSDYGKLAGRAIVEHERDRMKQLQKKARADAQVAAVRQKLKEKPR